MREEVDYLSGISDETIRRIAETRDTFSGEQAQVLDEADYTSSGPNGMRVGESIISSAVVPDVKGTLAPADSIFHSKTT